MIRPIGLSTPFHLAPATIWEAPAAGDSVALGATAAPAPAFPCPARRLSAPARLYLPTASGFSREDRVPSGDVASPDRSVFVGDDSVLRAVDSAGTVRFEVPLDPTDRAAFLATSDDAVFVRTGRSLLSFDLATGHALGRVDFGASDYSRRIQTLSDGTLVCASFDGTVGLNRDLSQRWASEGGMRGASIRPLAGGAVLLVDEGFPTKARVLGPDGAVRFRCDRAVGHSTHVDDAGAVWVVEQGESRGVFGSDNRIKRFDPVTGAIEERKATQATEGVVPLRGGSYLVAHRYIEKPRLILYGADGQQQRSFAFGDDDSYRRHTIRQVLLRSDHTAAYALVDHHSDRGGVEHHLYRMDLAPTVQQAGSGALFQTPVDEGEPLFRSADDFQPAVLSDGRIALYLDGRIEMLDARGFAAPTYGGPADLGPVTEDAVRVRVGHFTDPDPALGLKTCADLARFRFHYDEAVPAVDDGCLSLRIGAADVTETGFKDLAEWDQARVPRDLLNFAWRPQHDLPLPGGRPGRLEVKRDEIHVVDGARTVEIRAGGGARFVAVQPFQAGDRLCVAAATSDGMLTWHDTTAGPMAKPLRIKVGSPVQSMGLTDARTLRCIATDGTVLLLTPPLAAGESLTGAAAVTTPAPQAPPITIDPTHVTIAGIPIPRRSGS